MRAHDEALDRLPVPLAGLGNLLGEGFDFGDGVQDSGRGRDEAPLVREGVDDGLGLRLERARARVEAVQVQAGLVRGDREDVLLEGVVAELARMQLVYLLD